VLHCRDVMRCDGSKNLSATLAHGKTVKMYSTRCPALFTVEGITNMFRRGGPVPYRTVHLSVTWWLSVFASACSFLLVVFHTDFTPKRDNGSLSCQFHKSQSVYAFFVFFTKELTCSATFRYLPCFRY